MNRVYFLSDILALFHIYVQNSHILIGLYVNWALLDITLNNRYMYRFIIIYRLQEIVLPTELYF